MLFSQAVRLFESISSKNQFIAQKSF